VPCGPVHSLPSLLNDPHLNAVGLFEPNYTERGPYLRSLRQPVLWRGVEARPDRRPPQLGADASAILREVGFDEAETADLISRRVVISPETTKD